MKKMKLLIQVFMAVVMGFFVTACSSDDEDSSSVKLTLKGSVEQIVANGVDSVTFTVWNGEVDVTAQTKIYKGTTVLPGVTFTSTTAGEYKFMAKYENVLSNELVVKVVPVSTFKKKALLAVWTSTNCIHCPKMADQLKNVWIPGRSGQFVTIYYHGMMSDRDDDPFVVKDSKGGVLFEGDMASWFNCIGGYPKAKLDAEYNMTYQDPASRFDLVLKKQPNSGLAIETLLMGEDLTVTVRTKADVDYPYEPGLAVWLTESGMVEPQATVDDKILTDYVHNYVVRASLCDDYKGMLLPNEYRKANKEYVYQTVYKVPANFNKENLTVVAYVYQNVPKTVSDGGHLIDNVQEVKVGKNAGYEYR